eukprot:6409509-Heterocapsa_arctica.AAC.1
MDETGDCASKLHRITRIPDEDRHQNRHRAGGVQHRSRSMEDLQEPNLPQMRHHRQGRGVINDSQREDQPSCLSAC